MKTYNEDTHLVYTTHSLVVTFLFIAKTQNIELSIYNKTREDWKELFVHTEEWKPWHYETLFSQKRSMLGLVSSIIRKG